MDAIDFHADIAASELAAASGTRYPSLGADPKGGVLTVAEPHRLRVHVGSEVIELHPGGYNSATYIETGRPAPKESTGRSSTRSRPIPARR